MLAPLTTYAWRIDALGLGGSTPGVTQSFTTGENLPAKAVNLSPASGAANLSSVLVIITWAAAAGADSYDVYLNGVLLGNQAGTSKTLLALVDGATYTWRVDSRNIAGVVSGDTWSFSIASAPPVAPSKAISPTPANAAPAVTPGVVALSWANGGGATSYSVYVDSVFKATQAGTSFNTASLGAFTAHTWRIDSINATGTTTGDTWTFTTDGHVVVVDWAQRVVINGGASPSLATKAAMHTFCTGLDTASLASKLAALNCFASDSLIAALTPLYYNAGSDPWTNHNFVVGDLTVNGLIGNGSSKYLQTGVKPGDVGGQPNSGGLTIYYFTNPNDNGAELVGNSGGIPQFGLQFYAGTVYFDCYAYNTGRISKAASAFTGYVSGNRTTAAREDLYTANSGTAHSSVVSGTGAPGALSTNELYCFAANNAGVAAYQSAKRLSFAAIHSGLSSGESSTFYSLIQALRTALGGGFV